MANVTRDFWKMSLEEKTESDLLEDMLRGLNIFTDCSKRSNADHLATLHRW